MRVAFCINTSWNIFNFRKILIDHFLEEGYEVHCIAPRDDFSSKLIELGCHFHPINLEAKGSNPIKDLLFGWRLSKILKKEKIDVLLSYTIKPNIYSGLFFPIHKVPIIANISGLGTTFIRKNLSSLAAQKLYKR